MNIVDGSNRVLRVGSRAGFALAGVIATVTAVAATAVTATAVPGTSVAVGAAAGSVVMLAAGATAAASTNWTPAQQATLLSIQQDWAKVNYDVVDEDQKAAGFEALAQRAQSLVAASPGRAEPLIWQGIVLSTWAGVKGGFGALSLAKQARDALESALKIDPSALEGSAYTSLGTLYYKVPGFPIGFGDHKKARQLLEAALKVNPDGIDSNYFYGEYLFDEDRYADAVVYLNRALAAAPRPNREVADRGRRVEIESLLGKARAKAG